MTHHGTAAVLALTCVAAIGAEQNPGKRLEFPHGAPVIAVRVAEGLATVNVSSPTGVELTAEANDGAEVPLGAATTISVARTSGWPAQVAARIKVAEFPLRAAKELAIFLTQWQPAEVKVVPVVRGIVFGVGGKVIDNRIVAVVVDEPPAPPTQLQRRQGELFAKYGLRTSLVEETVDFGQLELDVAYDKSAAAGIHWLLATPSGEAPIHVSYAGKSSSYRGSLLIAADSQGTIAVINRVDIEDLLRGMVPAEIFPSAPAEALKAQAVAARGVVLAKIGLRHFADPYHLCSEQHCAVYKGVAGETPTTDTAVLATRGEAAFDADERLVNSTFSANCGGHTENNEAVWGTPPDASLRGRPDLLPGRSLAAQPTDVAAFLKQDSTVFACGRAPTHFRWERTLSADDVNSRLAEFKLGRIMVLKPAERGVSGRVIALRLSGTDGAAVLRGELKIRQVFGGLESAMFEVTSEADARGVPVRWRFVGGGWGHGVGLCQMGAIGRASQGQSYRQIVRHYFNGAVVLKLY